MGREIHPSPFFSGQTEPLCCFPQLERAVPVLNNNKRKERTKHMSKKSSKISYAKYGYLFSLPFVIIYAIFHL